MSNFREINEKLLNPSVLEKTHNHMNKIEVLLQKLIKSYYTRLQNPPDSPTPSQFNSDFLKTFKHMSYLLYIVTLEITHCLEDLELSVFRPPILTLFQFFKHSSIVFMRENVTFYNQLLQNKQMETLAEEK